MSLQCKNKCSSPYFLISLLLLNGLGSLGCETVKLYAFFEYSSESVWADSDSLSSDEADSSDSESDTITGDSESDIIDSDSDSDSDSGSDSDSDSDTDWYPCNDDTEGYNATVILNGDVWTVQNGGTPLYTGSDMESAIRAAYGSLTDGRTTKESILIQGSGDVSADTRIRIPSYTVVNVCGTINVTGSGTGDKSPIYVRDATDIDIPNVRITGSPNYGIFLREADNVRLGQIVLELDEAAWLGMRIDHSSSAAPGKPMFGNYQIDSIYVSGCSGHGVETFGITNMVITEMTAENTGNCGLNLNYTTNTRIGSLHGYNCGTGTGNAALCFANQVGNVNDDNSYPEGNVHIESLYARNGGRGVLSLYDSGGIVIDYIDIAGTEDNAILLDSAHRITIAAVKGIVEGPGNISIIGTSDNVLISNLTLQNSGLNENPCGTNIVWSNLTLVNSEQNTCQ